VCLIIRLGSLNSRVSATKLQGPPQISHASSPKISGLLVSVERDKGAAYFPSHPAVPIFFSTHSCCAIIPLYDYNLPCCAFIPLDDYSVHLGTYPALPPFSCGLAPAVPLFFFALTLRQGASHPLRSTLAPSPKGQSSHCC